MAQMKKDFQRVLNDDAGHLLPPLPTFPPSSLSLSPPPPPPCYFIPIFFSAIAAFILPANLRFVRVQRCHFLRELHTHRSACRVCSSSLSLPVGAQRKARMNLVLFTLQMDRTLRGCEAHSVAGACHTASGSHCQWLTLPVGRSAAHLSNTLCRSHLRSCP